MVVLQHNLKAPVDIRNKVLMLFLKRMTGLYIFSNAVFCDQTFHQETDMNINADNGLALKLRPIVC